MKRLAITALTFLILVSMTQAQTTQETKTQKKETKKEAKSEKEALKNLDGNKVSTIAMNSFKTDFPNAKNTQWKRNGTFDEASFTNGGKQMTAFYDIEGKLVGTTQVAALTDLPANAQTEIKSKYKDYTVGPVVFFDDNEANPTDMVMYGVQFDDADTWLVELVKGSSKIVVQVEKNGSVGFFKQL
jgi:hypothetical protein